MMAVMLDQVTIILIKLTRPTLLLQEVETIGQLTKLRGRKTLSKKQLKNLLGRVPTPLIYLIVVQLLIIQQYLGQIYLSTFQTGLVHVRRKEIMDPLEQIGKGEIQMMMK